MLQKFSKKNTKTFWLKKSKLLEYYKKKASINNINIPTKEITRNTLFCLVIVKNYDAILNTKWQSWYNKNSFYVFTVCLFSISLFIYEGNLPQINNNSTKLLCTKFTIFNRNFQFSSFLICRFLKLKIIIIVRRRKE